MRKIPFAGIELTSQRVRGLRGTSELPGRPATGQDVSWFNYKLVIPHSTGWGMKGEAKGRDEG